MVRMRGAALLCLVCVLVVLCGYVSVRTLARQEAGMVRVAFLDVGQGDAIFIESPTGTQIIVDGGPDNSLLRVLPLVMDPFDRTLDAVIVTNPDQDHFAGFIPLLERYKVAKEFEPGTKKTTVTYRALERELEKNEVPRILVRQGMALDLGGGAYVQILYPDRDVSNAKPNDGSVVMKLVYGKTSVMLMGDSTAYVESRLLGLSTTTLSTDILKLGHHGSKTSSSLAWLRATAPSQTVVSAGCDNSYGHPSEEIIGRLTSMHIPYLWTCKEGTIEFLSDGVRWNRI